MKTWHLLLKPSLKQEHTAANAWLSLQAGADRALRALTPGCVCSVFTAKGDVHRM